MGRGLASRGDLKRILGFTYWLAGRCLRKRRCDRILVYHTIENCPGATVSVAEFEAHLRLLKAAGSLVDVYSLCDAQAAYNKKPRFAVTIDDGYSVVVRNILPIIRRERVPVTVFVPGGLLGQRICSGRYGLRVGYSIVSGEEIRRLEEQSEGLLRFGAHGYLHRNLGGASGALVDGEVKRGVEELRRYTCVKAFAFPWGQRRDLSFEAIKAGQEVGVEFFFSTIWGCVQDRLQGVISRCVVDGIGERSSFRLLVEGGFDFLKFVHLGRRGARQ